MTDSPIFFLIKGEYVPDSRNHEGLRHHLTIEKSGYSVNAGEPLSITVEIENSGKALWLHRNIKGRFRLVFDLVSEYVCWFEENGSQPAAVTVNVI
jgi:hypothetical protein